MDKNIRPWYTKLSKVASLMILVFVLVIYSILRLQGDLAGYDVGALLCALLIATLLGSME